MSKIMDRVFDLSAVDWITTPTSTLDQWEREALSHDRLCRCHKCALLFARMDPRSSISLRACAIHPQVIEALRQILNDCHKR